jgi:hypothetical protein
MPLPVVPLQTRLRQLEAERVTRTKALVLELLDDGPSMDALPTPPRHRCGPPRHSTMSSTCIVQNHFRSARGPRWQQLTSSVLPPASRPLQGGGFGTAGTTGSGSGSGSGKTGLRSPRGRLASRGPDKWDFTVSRWACGHGLKGQGWDVDTRVYSTGTLALWEVAPRHWHARTVAVGLQQGPVLCRGQCVSLDGCGIRPGWCRGVTSF